MRFKGKVLGDLVFRMPERKVLVIQRLDQQEIHDQSTPKFMGLITENDLTQQLI